MTSVAVMMSVHNGEEYLTEQIESILVQQGVDVALYIRDDGSAKPARCLLARYAADHANIHVTHGPNLGIKDSFLYIVHEVPLTYDYYAFSDGDDVWLPEKLASAVALLSAQDPAVAQAYCSQITLVDKTLKFIGYGRPLNRPITFRNALIEGRMSGATAVFNRTLVGIAKRLNYRDANMHDTWMNLIAAGFGNVHFDPQSYILYRQHGSNADGGIRTAGQSWRGRFARAALFRRFARQGQTFLMQVHDQLSADKKDALERLVRYGNGNLSGLRFFFDRDFEYQRGLSKLVTALALLSKSK